VQMTDAVLAQLAPQTTNKEHGELVGSRR